MMDWFSFSTGVGSDFCTVMLQEADTLLPSWLSAVMVVLPSPIAVTRPLSTDATSGLLLLHFNCLFPALSGVIAASKSTVCPISKAASVWLNVIFSTFMDAGRKRKPFCNAYCSAAVPTSP